MVDYLLSSGLVESINSLMYSIHNVTFNLLSTFLIIYIMFVGFKLMMSEGDLRELNIPRLLFILFAFFTYEAWSIALAKVIVSIASAIFESQNQTPFHVFEKVFDKPNFEFSIWDFVTGEYSFEEVVMMVALVLIFFATSVFTTVQVLLQAFLFIMGPFAVALSIFPVWKNALSNWFKNFMATNMWSIFYAVFLALFTVVSNNLLEDPLNDYAQLLSDTKSPGVSAASEIGFDVSLKMAGMCIITLVGIVMIPSISSKIIPDAGIGGVGSMFSGLGTLASMAGGAGIAKQLAKAPAKWAGKKAKDGAKWAGGKTWGGLKSVGNSVSEAYNSRFGNSAKSEPVKPNSFSSPSSSGASGFENSYFSPSSSTSSSSFGTQAEGGSGSKESVNQNTKVSPKPKASGDQQSAYSNAKEKFNKASEMNSKGISEEEAEVPEASERPKPNYPPNHKMNKSKKKN